MSDNLNLDEMSDSQTETFQVRPLIWNLFMKYR